LRDERDFIVLGFTLLEKITKIGLLHEKNNFAERLKILTGYRSENFVDLSK